MLTSNELRQTYADSPALNVAVDWVIAQLKTDPDLLAENQNLSDANWNEFKTQLIQCYADVRFAVYQLGTEFAGVTAQISFRSGVPGFCEQLAAGLAQINLPEDFSQFDAVIDIKPNRVWGRFKGDKVELQVPA